MGVISTANAQCPSNLENFSIKDGLSQSSITCAFQSSDGILWFGTQDGLNEYDGYDFTIFKYNPEDSNSLSNNYINDITEDDKGNLIIATRAGITIWNRNKNTYKHYKHNQQNPNSISDNDVLQVLYHENTIWALTEKSLDKFIDENVFEHNFFVSDSTTNRYIYNSLDLIADKENNIWLATKDGVNIFYPKPKQFYRIHDNGSNCLSSQRIRDLLIDNESNVWIGTFFGLNKFIKSSGRFSSYFYNNIKENIRENTINDVLITDTIFWIGTKNGLKTFKNEQICEFENPLISSIKDQVTVILKDLSGNIWCGTIGSGLYKITMHKPKFSTFTDFPRLADKTIFSIYADKNNIWTGSNGIYVIDKKTNSIVFYDDLIYNDSIQEVTVYCISEIDNKLWLGTDNGIFIADKETFEIVNIFDFLNIHNTNFVFTTRVSNIKKDREGVFWISTQNGLIKFHNNSFKTFAYNEADPNTISSNTVMSLLLDHNKIWIATYNGLNLFDKKTETFRHWTKKDGLPSVFILDIEKTSKNTLWISTASGLTKMNINKETFKNFTSINFGFKNDFFYNIEKGLSKNIWLTSNYGVVKFNSSNYSFETYDLKDGLASLECNVGSTFVDDNNNFFFGSINGISWCNFLDTNKVIIAPKVLITKIEKQGFNQKKEVIDFPDSNKIYNFTYKDILTIFFAVPEYTFPTSNKFKYKIDGLNDNWSNEQTGHFINLTGISAGTYTLLIKGSNSQGIWNSTATKIHFRITPPYWRTTIAYIIYIMIFLSIVTFSFLYVYKNVKKENEILQDKNIVLEQLNYQRKLLQEKNKSTTDSINYAKKIIEAILPPPETFNRYLPDSFIFFLPKDIVSGDFYWFTEKNDNIFIAAVDCTGHGIPGAFMSIIGINLLESIVNDGITDPAIFLNIMNKEIISTLKKDLDKKHLKDGMDMTMCIIDKRRKQLKYAGAYNPAYILRDDSIIQLKGDRKSVGNDFDLNPFTPFSMKIREDDVIYLFSDGYTDQFGGKTEKKFKFRRFRLLMLSIHKLPLNLQKQKLLEAFTDWKGEAEQVDDVLVIGFKPLSFENKID